MSVERGQPVPQPQDLTRWVQIDLKNIHVDPKHYDKVFTDLATLRAGQSVGAVSYRNAKGRPTIGTCTLLEHKGILHALTCDHVAKEFLADREARILFSRGAFLRRDQVSLHRHNAR